jgi:VanZ family protein
MKVFKFYKTLICFSVIVFLSVYPFSTNSGIDIFEFPYFDKLVHFIFYLVFSFLFIHELHEFLGIKKPRKRLIFPVFLLALFIGASLELVQHYFIPVRSGSFFDLLANIVGSITGIMLYNVYPKSAKFLRHF